MNIVARTKNSLTSLENNYSLRVDEDCFLCERGLVFRLITFGALQIW